MQTPGAPEKAYVLVEYEFEYTAKDGRFISIKPNERYLLLKKTNDHWWHVRKDGQSKPFYIPAKYVKELPAGIQPSNGLLPHTEQTQQQPIDSFQDATDVGAHQYSYKFISLTPDTPCNPYNPKSNLTQPHLSLCESGSNLSIPDICVTDVLPKGSKEDLLPEIGEERLSSAGYFAPLRTPLRTFGSFHRLPVRNTMYGPEFTTPISIRYSQSLDDLARLSPERPIGGRRTEVLAGSRVYSRSLTRSDSENIYETIVDLPGQKNVVDLPAQEKVNVQEPPRNEEIPARCPILHQPEVASHTPGTGNDSEGSDSHLQVSQEKDSFPVYVNIAELRQEAAKSGSSSRLHSTSSTLDEWETHTDQESGKLFYYNSITGETTWDSPFYHPEDTVNSPSPLTCASSPIDTEWERYFDEPTGRFFFYNCSTGETSWQPPDQDLSPHDMKPGNFPFNTMEKRPPTPETDYPEYPPFYDAFPEEDYSPRDPHHNFIFPYIQPEFSPTNDDGFISPPGWSCKTTKDGQRTFTHVHTHEMRPPPRPPQKPSIESDSEGITFSSWSGHMPPFIIPRNDEDLEEPTRRNAFDFTAEHGEAMLLESLQHRPKNLEKAGILKKSKIAENGKRLRKKNWSPSWTVLEGSILTFYKEAKNLSTSSLKQSSSFSVPEYTVELQGASICWAAKEKSSKKNVLELKTRDGSEYLIQHDSESITEDWYKVILDSIQTLPTVPMAEHNNHPPEHSPNERLEGNNKEKEDKKTQGTVTKNNDLTMDSTDSSRVRNKLKRLLQRRPTLQSLRDKGIIKDQVFGCHLHELCEREKTAVPRFVKECIKTVESRGLDIDGLYRISGNLATIQKLRFKVDHEENLNLDDGRWEDVHVITGALKLFFRELPEPLFPFSHFDRFISAIKITDPKTQINYMKELVQSLPTPNHETMKALFQHLCRIIDRREENRMSVKSVAIVFGPTLLKKESEMGNIAMHMVFQNQIVEQLLSNCNYIFADS
ncbi:rho GTPase-activating protein 27 isoform X3 [Ambystoma mexicanum]|uniref:rho GTPase-activating protein 27 isoform X3 n=1 Tax=Ambystoma mexicanum TaxID=8296 RepID=UPI0037E75C54